MRIGLSVVRRSVVRRRTVSEHRKSLRTMLIEGIPANIIGNLLGGPLQTAFLLYLGFTSDQIGLVLSIPSLTLLVQVFVAFAMQKWTDRKRIGAWLAIGHRVLWTATGLVPLLFPQAAWVPMYIVLFLLSFTLGQMCGIIWTSLISDAVPPAVRGKYFGVRNTIHFAVVCATLLIGGQILERIPGGYGFAILFAVCVVCVVWNGREWFRYPNPPFQPMKEGASFRALIRPFADVSFISATAFISLFLLLQNLVVPLFSYAMLNILDLSYSQVTLIVMLQNVVMVISYYGWGLANGRYPARKLLMWTFPLIAASCFLWLGMAGMPVTFVLILVHVLLGVGLSGYTLLVFNFLIGDSPKSERPIYVAVFNGLTGIVGFLGPLVGGWLFRAVSGAPEWIRQYGLISLIGLSMLVLAVAAGPLIFRTRPRKPSV